LDTKQVGFCLILLNGKTPNEGQDVADDDDGVYVFCIQRQIRNAGGSAGVYVFCIQSRHQNAGGWFLGIQKWFGYKLINPLIYVRACARVAGGRTIRLKENDKAEGEKI